MAAEATVLPAPYVHSGLIDHAFWRKLSRRCGRSPEKIHAHRPNQAPSGASPQVVFGLAQGGIDAIVASLAQAGVEVVTPVTEAPGGWSAEFKDPAGHNLSLYQDDALPR